MLRDLKPTDNVGGFDVRPGNFLLNGATTVSGGVNFTIHSVYAVYIAFIQTLCKISVCKAQISGFLQNRQHLFNARVRS